SVAPFSIGLINLKPGDAACDAACAKLYAALGGGQGSILYDDTSESPGAKFKTMDLIGLPWQVNARPQGLANGEVEIKRRATGERSTLALDAAIKKLQQSQTANAAPAPSDLEPLNTGTMPAQKAKNRTKARGKG